MILFVAEWEEASNPPRPLSAGQGAKVTCGCECPCDRIHGRAPMLPLTWSTRLKKGIVLCWLSLLTLPVGLLAIGGPCTGPRNITGSLIILLAGLLSVAMPVYGV